MKSSSKIINAGNVVSICEPWLPIDLTEGQILQHEFINASTDDFFETKEIDQNKKRGKIIPAGQILNNLHPWQPAEMDTCQLKNNNVAVQNWTPFLEKPNPRKIADQVIEDANKKAEEIITQANLGAEQLKLEAYNQSIEEATKEMKETLQAAASVINVAREWRIDMMNQAEPIIIDLVKKMAQKIFSDGLVLDNTVLQRHFSEILETTRSLGDLRIFMHPDDAKILGPDWREYQTSILGNKVEIVTNDSIKRGGCYIQGEWGTADALVETQLNAILEQFAEVESPEKGDD